MKIKTKSYLIYFVMLIAISSVFCLINNKANAQEQVTTTLQQVEKPQYIQVTITDMDCDESENRKHLPSVNYNHTGGWDGNIFYWEDESGYWIASLWENGEEARYYWYYKNGNPGQGLGWFCAPYNWNDNIGDSYPFWGSYGNNEQIEGDSSWGFHWRHQYWDKISTVTINGVSYSASQINWPDGNQLNACCRQHSENPGPITGTFTFEYNTNTDYYECIGMGGVGQQTLYARFKLNLDVTNDTNTVLSNVKESNTPSSYTQTTLYNDPVTSSNAENAFYRNPTVNYTGYSQPTGSNSTSYNNTITSSYTPITKKHTQINIINYVWDSGKWTGFNGGSGDSYVIMTTLINHVTNDPNTTSSKSKTYGYDVGSQRPCGSSSTNLGTKYEIGTVVTRNDTINYKANTPAISQTYYTPYNLNYNNIVQYSDTIKGTLDSQYYNKTPLAMSVNNKHNTHGSLMETLDLNNAYQFDVTFNEGTVFGLPGSTNWYDTPANLDNGSWEYAGHSQWSTSSSYANGRGNHDYHYNTTLNASLTGNESSAIEYNGNEYMNTTGFTKQDKDKIFRGGTFASKFVLTGNYTTSNTEDKYKDWWAITYNQGKAYEYGTYYTGKVTNAGFFNPTLKTGYNAEGFSNWGACAGNSAGGTTINFETKSDSSNKAPYVGFISKTFYQPVLYGKWDVKTIAGNIK